MVGKFPYAWIFGGLNLILPASGPATSFKGTAQAERKERRGPEGEREEREVGTNPGGWR